MFFLKQQTLQNFRMAFRLVAEPAVSANGQAQVRA